MEKSDTPDSVPDNVPYAVSVAETATTIHARSLARKQDEENARLSTLTEVTINLMKDHVKRAAFPLSLTDKKLQEMGAQSKADREVMVTAMESYFAQFDDAEMYFRVEWVTKKSSVFDYDRNHRNQMITIMSLELEISIVTK
jgi:hypothetical protein